MIFILHFPWAKTMRPLPVIATHSALHLHSQEGSLPLPEETHSSECGDKSLLTTGPSDVSESSQLQKRSKGGVCASRQKSPKPRHHIMEKTGKLVPYNLKETGIYGDKFILTTLLLFSPSVVSNSLWLHGLQHTRLPCPSLSPRVCSESYPLSQWYHPTSSYSVASYAQSFPASVSFPMNQLFRSDGQSIVALPSTSVLPMNIQGWFPLGLTGLISLLSKELSRVFSSTTVWKHQFFSSQPSLWSHSHICTWPLEKP